MATLLRIILTPASPAPFESWHFLVPATDQRGTVDGRLEGAVRVALRESRRHALLI